MKVDEGSEAPKPTDPVAMARRDLKTSLPRRFYKDVSVTDRNDAFGIELDGKPVRTPAKAPFVVPTRTLAELLAEEWRAQDEWIDPGDMPATRLVNTAIDGVSKMPDATATEVAKYAETDLVCYRAGEPETLVAAQSAAWDPILAFARDRLDARFVCAEGMMYAPQPDMALVAVRSAIDAIAAAPSGAVRLAALSLMTSLTGSVLIALAVAEGEITAEQGWKTAHVDEDWQLRHWGQDAEALTRCDSRWRAMQTAATVYTLAG